MKTAPPDSPYRGLVPYDEADAPFFRGREKETRLVVANLHASRLTLLYGPSGVGKSSILRAGALYQLRSRPRVLGVYFNQWKGDVLTGLKVAVTKAALPHVAFALPGAVEPARAGWKLKPPLFAAPLGTFLTQWASLTKRHLLIILDQFEEYFLYHPEGEPDEFAAQFPPAVTQRRVPASFLVSLRDDSLSQLDRFEAAIPNLFSNYLRVEHLSLEAARAAITEPVEEYGRRAPGTAAEVQEELVVEVIAQLSAAETRDPRGGATHDAPEGPRGQSIKAPYLQLVMVRLWNEEARRGSHVLTVKTLNALGSVRKIIDTHMNGVMRRLSWRQRRLASRVFFFLVSPSGTKIAHTAPDLAQMAGASPARVEKLLGRLAGPDFRVLNSFEVEATEAADQTTARARRINYEIYHDFLARPLLAWRARQRLYQRLLAVLPLSLLVVTIALIYARRLQSILGGQGGWETYAFYFVSFLVFVLPGVAIGILTGWAWARAR
jgi:hypothetical protein